MFVLTVERGPLSTELLAVLFPDVFDDGAKPSDTRRSWKSDKKQ